MKTIRLLLILFLAAGLTSSRAQDTWTQKADFGGGNTHATKGFTIGNKAYMGTGKNGGIVKKDFWEYNPVTDVWTQKADFGGGVRYAGVGFSIGNIGYFGTGASSDGNYTKDFWAYDPATNIWVKKADFGGAVRFLSAGFSIGDKGYIGTGINGGFTYLKDFWEYDPATDLWTQKANFGGGIRGHASGFNISSKGYIGTGLDGTNTKNDFWEYNPATDAWSQKANFGGVARISAVGFSIGNKGYIGTGLYNNETQKDFWEYDVTTDTWTQKADFGGVGRVYAFGFSIGEKGYVGTGDAGGPTYLKDFWQYTPSCSGITIYADADGDSYGDATVTYFAADCVVPTGYVYNSTDCNDANASIHPDACDASNGNGIDDNCDGIIDNGFGATTYYIDADGDGYGTGTGTSLCINPGAGYSINNSDCDDNNATINPVAYEIIVDGIDNNCNGIVDEDLNNALDFDGVNDYVQTPVSSNVTTYTLEAWIKPTLAKDMAIIGNDDDNWHGKSWVLSSNGKMYIHNAHPSSFNDIWSTGSVPIGQWSHVVASVNAGTVTFYINGISSGSGSPVEQYGLPWWIGRGWTYHLDGAYFNGQIDEVRIWNVARTQAEIQANMNTSICSNANGLVAYYPFNQGIAGEDNAGLVTAEDLSTNNKDGTLKNFSLIGSNSNWVADVPDITPVTCEDDICVSPMGLNMFDITATSTELSWNDNPDALGYVIKYNTEDGSGAAKVTYSKSNSKPISGLTPNTAYFWRVKSVCSEDPKFVSDWSEKQYFTTAPLKVANQQTTTMELYPNPVADQFTLNLQLPTLSNQAADIFLLNTLGQVRYSAHASAGNGTLNQVIAMPATAASGWYVVRVVLSDQVMEQKLLYQK